MSMAEMIWVGIHEWLDRWVYHHYCAMLMALVSLTWGIQGHPSCTHKQVILMPLFIKIFWNSFFTLVHSIFLFRHLNWVVFWIFHILDFSTGYLWVGLWSWCLQQGVRLFLGWAVMQGVAMLLQNRYQRQRLYTRIALGKVYFPCTLV
jgi:hypothetical protein